MISIWWAVVIAIIFTFIGCLLCALCITSEKIEDTKHNDK